MTTSRPDRGSALLAVLWLTAALSAIAFTVANSVRTETERTTTDVDSLKTYYLATGAVAHSVGVFDRPEILQTVYASIAILVCHRRCIGRRNSGIRQAQHQ